MRKMRRFGQMLPEEMTMEILERGEYGVMAILADDDYPYAVPISYYFDRESMKIYFHGAKSGMRIDAIENAPRCSFCVVDLNENDPEHYSTNYRSAIAFGSARNIQNDTEEYAYAIQKLTEKFVKCYTEEQIAAQIKLESANCLMNVIDIEFVTGKESRELMEERKKSQKLTH